MDDETKRRSKSFAKLILLLLLVVGAGYLAISWARHVFDDHYDKSAILKCTGDHRFQPARGGRSSSMRSTNGTGKSSGRGRGTSKTQNCTNGIERTFSKCSHTPTSWAPLISCAVWSTPARRELGNPSQNVADYSTKPSYQTAGAAFESG
jgi:hypothetical protein